MQAEGHPQPPRACAPGRIVDARCGILTAKPDGHPSTPEARGQAAVPFGSPFFLGETATQLILGALTGTGSGLFASQEGTDG